MSEASHAAVAATRAGCPTPELTLSHLDSLPTLAPIAVRVIQITLDPRADAAELVRVLQGDAALAAALLRVAGSAAFGARGPVQTVERAVSLLGFPAVRSIVLAVKVFECFPQEAGGARRAFDRREFWKHCVAVACAARRFAAACPTLGVKPDEAFLAGVLHDLGKVALDAVFPKAYERAAARAEQTRGDIADAERAILGADHTVAGRQLASRWGLAPGLQEVIWLHHLAPDGLPSIVEAPAMIALVQLADTLARELRIGYSGNNVFYDGAALLAENLGLPEGECERVAKALPGDVAELSGLLGIDVATPEAVCFDSILRANSELSRLNTDMTSANRRLAAAARVLRVLAQFDQAVRVSRDLAGVVSAAADAASLALQRRCVGVFALGERGVTLDVSWVGEGEDDRFSRVEGIPADLGEWIRLNGVLTDIPAHHAPPAVQRLFAALAPSPGEGDWWLLPVLADGRLTGGVAYPSPRNERERTAEEAEELRALLARFSLAFTRRNELSAARRLSDELAETNRRLQQVRGELLRSRALGMIAEMAAGAGHELNGPLSVISGRAQMLQREIDDPEQARSLSMIVAKAHECSQIVTELMEFARSRPPTFAPIDVAAVLSERREAWLLKAGLPASALRLELEPRGDSRRRMLTLADRGQVAQAVDELLANALDALGEKGGTVTLAARVVPPEGIAPSPAAHRPWDVQGQRRHEGWIEIIVRDNGAGMPRDVLQRAFDPFYSYRAAGRRRGLGLPRAYRVAEAHGGRIWLESEPGEGTTAHFALPIVAERAPAGDPPKSPDPAV